MEIKEIRKKLNMSQSEFAKYLSLSKRTLQSWEQGDRNPPDYVIGLILRVLKSEHKL